MGADEAKSDGENAPILFAAAWACSLANFAGSMVLMVVYRGAEDVQRARGRGLGTRRRREKIKVYIKTCTYNASQMPREAGVYLPPAIHRRSRFGSHT